MLVKDDQYYTNPLIAKQLIDLIDLSKYSLIVEPSAGNGSFSKLLPNCIAMDIDPKDHRMIKQDFLTWDTKCLYLVRKNVLVIGNPPFGRNCSLALKFINKAITFADTIAFILPLSFKKDSIQKKIDINYHLVESTELMKNSFIIGEDTPYDVPCVFQIWNNKYEPRAQPAQYKPVGYQYVKNNMDYDIAVRRVGWYAGKGYIDKGKADQSHYFIKFNDASDIEYKLEILNQYQWEHNNTVGPRSISKSELNQVLSPLVNGI